MNQNDKETVPLELPKDLIAEYRRIAKAENMTGSEIVAWCLSHGFRAYEAGERPLRQSAKTRSVGSVKPLEDS